MFATLLGVLMVLVSGGAIAAAVDVTDIVTNIEGNIVSIVAVGTAILTVVYAARVFSWLRKI